MLAMCRILSVHRWWYHLLACIKLSVAASQSVPVDHPFSADDGGLPRDGELLHDPGSLGPRPSEQGEEAEPLAVGDAAEPLAVGDAASQPGELGNPGVPPVVEEVRIADVIPSPPRLRAGIGVRQGHEWRDGFDGRGRIGCELVLWA